MNSSIAKALQNPPGEAGKKHQSENKVSPPPTHPPPEKTGKPYYQCSFPGEPNVRSYELNYENKSIGQYCLTLAA